MQKRIFDPWEACARMGVTITRTTLTNARGYTNGHDTIWVHDGLGRCEERVTITHELAHIALGHEGPQPPDVEEQVRRSTARWLIPWPCLTHHMARNTPMRAIAAELCVTIDVLQDRLDHATTAELNQLRKVTPCETSAA